MERAARQCYKWIHKRKPKGKTIKLFCGTGNNGGDGLAIARMLTHQGYRCMVFIVKYSEKYSDDFLINQNRLKDIDEIHIQEINNAYPMPEISSGDLVIDAIFGSGLSKPVSSFPACLLDHINASGAVVIAIDIPSGMFSDKLPDQKNPTR